MNTPKKHHFVPQFYLRGFIKDSSVDGRLWVFDLEKRNSGPIKPANVACEEDFYKGDIGADIDPMWLELGLGTLNLT